MLEDARSTLLNGHHSFTSLLEDFIVMFDYRRVKKMKRFEEPSNTLRSTWQWNWWQIALGSLQLRSLFVLCRPFWFYCLATQTNPNPKYIDVLDHDNPVPSPSMSLVIVPKSLSFFRSYRFFSKTQQNAAIHSPQKASRQYQIRSSSIQLLVGGEWPIPQSLFAPNPPDNGPTNINQLSAAVGNSSTLMNPVLAQLLKAPHATHTPEVHCRRRCR